MGTPQPHQYLDRQFVQIHETIFASFALTNMHLHATPVDVSDLQIQQAQAHAVSDPPETLVMQLAATPDDACNLVLRQDIRQRLHFRC